MNTVTRQQLKNHRAGLAPLELVLALPMMLFVMALMVNFGTASAWKVRAQINSRYAAWRSLHVRTGGGDAKPANWSSSKNSMGQGGGAVVSSVDPLWDQAPNPVVRGPAIPAGQQGGSESIQVVRDLTMRDGVHRGNASRTAQMPMLREMLDSAGEYRFNPQQRMLDHRWEFHDMRFPYNSWPRARGGMYPAQRGGSGSLAGSELQGWYALEPDQFSGSSGLLGPLEQAYTELASYGSSNSTGLDVLDRDEMWRDMIRRWVQNPGNPQWRDFHPDGAPRGRRGIGNPRLRGRMEDCDPDINNIVYGPPNPNTGIRTGGFIQRLKLGPYTHGNAFVRFYSGQIGRRRSQIAALQQQMPPPADLAQQIQQLETEIEQLEEEQEPYAVFTQKALELINQLP